MHRQCKIKLRETFGLSVYSTELEGAKLDRIVQRKTREVRKRLCKKLDNLISYKNRWLMRKNRKKQNKWRQWKDRIWIRRLYTTIAAANSTRKSLTFSLVGIELWNHTEEISMNRIYSSHWEAMSVSWGNWGSRLDCKGSRNKEYDIWRTQKGIWYENQD